jgi:hypothetical protein
VVSQGRWLACWLVTVGGWWWWSGGTPTGLPAVPAVAELVGVTDASQRGRADLPSGVPPSQRTAQSWCGLQGCAT